MFDVDRSNHPFYISTGAGGGSGFPGLYEQRVTTTAPDSNEDSATGTGTLTFAVPMDAPDRPYYQSGVHGNMGGEIEVTDGASRVGAGPPSIDADGDGRYGDGNANGRRDCDEVVPLFERFDDEPVQSRPAAYDFTGNGRLGFADIVTLFEG